MAAASSPTPPARLSASLIAAPTSHSTTIATSKPASGPKELAVRPAAAALSAVTTSNRWTAAKPPNAGGPLKAYFKQVDWGAVTTTANAAIDAFSTASSSAGRAAAELAAKGGRRWQALLGRAAAVHPSLPSIIQCGAGEHACLLAFLHAHIAGFTCPAACQPCKLCCFNHEIDSTAPSLVAPTSADWALGFTAVHILY